MDARGSNYTATFEPAATTVVFTGEMAAGGTSAYTPLNEVFEKILATQPATITLNMKGLKSSDDAGKNSLYKFVIAARKQGTGLVVQGAALQPWHRELATGLKKFHNNITYAE